MRVGSNWRLIYRLSFDRKLFSLESCFHLRPCADYNTDLVTALDLVVYVYGTLHRQRCCNSARWAFEQISEVLIKSYKSCEGNIANALLHCKPGAGRPGALAEALRRLALGLADAPADIRCNIPQSIHKHKVRLQEVWMMPMSNDENQSVKVRLILSISSMHQGGLIPANLMQ